MTQKQFMIGLIENEIDRDLAQRQAMSEITENSERVIENVTKHKKAVAVSDSKAIADEVGEVVEEQDNAVASDGFEVVTEESENADEGEALDEDQEESKNVFFLWECKTQQKQASGLRLI